MQSKGTGGEVMFTVNGKTSDQNQGIGRGLNPWGGAEGIEWREPANFERLYRVYSRRVYSFCVNMNGDRADAEEITQETFVQLYRKLDTFRESDFYTWFHRLAVNVALAQLRSRKCAREITFEDADSDNENEAGPLPPQMPSPDQRLTKAPDRVIFQRALNALPFGYKTVFVLHDVEGYEHQEISEMTGLPVEASKSQLHRARLRMRALLLKDLARQFRSGQGPADASGGCQQSPARKAPFGGFNTPGEESAAETKLCRGREKEPCLRTAGLSWRTRQRLFRGDCRRTNSVRRLWPRLRWNHKCRQATLIGADCGCSGVFLGRMLIAAEGLERIGTQRSCGEA